MTSDHEKHLQAFGAFIRQAPKHHPERKLLAAAIWSVRAHIRECRKEIKAARAVTKIKLTE